ncbi:calcium permeable stress-gated cation channel, partial [Lecanoromycetidae sp. Uapishka_2]
MSSASASSAAPSATSLKNAFNASAGTAQQGSQGISLPSFLASLASGAAIFALELGLFLLLNSRFSRIYIPRTFLVPERERTKAPRKGLWQWILPVFQTSNSDFIQKCGLDAYFFLRYLRTLLKIFIPLALLVLPILLPTNAVHGRGPHFAEGRFGENTNWQNVTGLDQLAWGNVSPLKNNRYWAHLVLAIVVIFWTCFVFFDELRGYIRLRQAYLTSPQHRLRASATTVLVTAIPPKWCTFQALDGLYDVFPGGIRNIWINRNFDELNNKVKQRNKLAKSLESAETALIQKAKKKHMEDLKKEAEKAGGKDKKKRASDQVLAADKQGLAMAQTDGISSGDPHQVRHTIDEALAESDSEPSREQSQDRKKRLIPIPVLGQGLDAVGHGIGTIGKTLFGGLKTVEKDVDDRLNTTGGFVPATPEPAGAPPGQERGRVSFGLDGARLSSQSPDFAPDQGAHDATSGGDRNPQRREYSNDSTIRQSTSQDGAPDSRSQSNSGPNGLGIAGAPVDSGNNRNSFNSEVLHNPERLGEAGAHPTSRLKFWDRKKVMPYGIPSPTPHGQEEDEFPLSHQSPMTPGCNPQAVVNGKGSQDGITKAWKPPKETKKQKKEEVERMKAQYPVAFKQDYDPNEGKPAWKAYLKDKDRDTMRLPIFGWQWMFSIPLVGKKVDTINHCREELARLNLEIEQDQKEPEKFPLMNSAFIQFNHQMAAHMACQAVSHHTPNQMAPRVVEISPDDVIWDNMSLKWWESYIRTAVVIAIIVGLVIGWAFPVTFTGLLSQINYLTTTFKWLAWLKKAPTWVISIIQGILPQALLGLLLVLLPITLRFLAKTQGNHTGMGVELSVQQYYFAFLFVQVFLVVSISSGITTTIQTISSSPQSLPTILAANLPKASNYFFSYLLLQALSVSAGALVQVGGLVQWFILAPLLDKTARQKWRRQTNLPNMQWGTFFPVYTNLACIGLIYSVISPLILVFNIITFSLFWLVYRYNTLYVTKFRFDTGGLLFPTAINQLFTGLYFMELCLIGLFFLVKDAKPNGSPASNTPCKIQGIIMIVVMILTAIYQWLLNMAFGPLLRYLPITLEDEAVMRDDEFARAQEKRWNMEENEESGNDFNNVSKNRERRSLAEDREVEYIQMQNIEARNAHSRLDPRSLAAALPDAVTNLVPIRASWADRSRNKNVNAPNVNSPSQPGKVVSPHHRQHHHAQSKTPDVEAQRMGTNTIGDALFSGINDEIEDLTPDERDKLVQRAFQHEALRARRPVIWIPRDDLGVSDDEIMRTKEFSKHIWISNEFTGLDGKGRVIYRKSPPDFSEIDLIEL